MLFSATFPKQIENRVERVLSQLGCDSSLRLSTSAATTMSVLNSTHNGGGDYLVPSSNVRDYEKDSNNSNNNDDVDMDDINTTSSDDHTQLLSVNTNDANNVPRIRHRVIRLNEEDRTRALRFLIENNEEEQYDTNKVAVDDHDRILVFVATRHATEHVSKKLCNVKWDGNYIHYCTDVVTL